MSSAGLEKGTMFPRTEKATCMCSAMCSPRKTAEGPHFFPVTLIEDQCKQEVMAHPQHTAEMLGKGQEA